MQLAIISSCPRRSVVWKMPSLCGMRQTRNGAWPCTGMGRSSARSLRCPTRAITLEVVLSSWMVACIDLPKVAASSSEGSGSTAGSRFSAAH
ncbi:unnamed protein product, partial [Symbiodinium pilosum]